MNWKKHLIFVTLVFWIAASLVLPATSQAVGPPRVLIDGKELKTDVPGIIYNNRSMVPFRAILEALDAQVNWNGATRTVLAQKGQTDISLQINNNIAWVNAKSVKLDAPAIIVDNRTMVPVRFVAESLGETVEWDANKRIVRIETSKKAAEPVQPAQPTPGKLSGSILSENESLEYTPGKSALFLKGTHINFHANGMVSQGTLAEDSLLKFTDSESAIFKANTPVSFSPKGLVASGILLNDTRLPYRDTVPSVALYDGDGLSTSFKGGTEVVFADGLIISGTLLKDTILLYDNVASTEFCQGTVIEFTDQGRVKKGILGRPARLQFILGNLTKEETHIEFRERTPIEFKDNGYVKSGVLRYDTKLQYYSNQWAVFAEDNLVAFNDEGYVESGVLGEFVKLRYEGNREHGFAKGTKVAFNNEGYVISGILSYDLNTQGVIFSSDKPIVFWDNGKIRTATLRYDSTLSYVQGKTTQFEMGSEVEFNNSGYVIKGVLKHHSSLPYTDRSYYNLATFKGESAIEFNEQGLVAKGTLYTDAIMEYGPKKNTAFKAGEISFKDGFVERGILRHATGLEDITGQTRTYPANTTITFNPSGLVINSN